MMRRLSDRRNSSGFCYQFYRGPSEVATNSEEISVTSVLPLEDLDVAVRALGLVSRYDSMRLEAYRAGQNLADRIYVSPIGSALALRFDDVGYFNRVYCGVESVFESLAEIEEFYRGGGFGCEVVGPPVDGPGTGINISRPGWAPGHQYAWLFRDNSSLAPDKRPTEFTVRSPEVSERRDFLLAYLRAFEAQEDRIPGALRNMIHLFDRSELDFLMSWHGKTLAGVAMWMRCGEAALLCAGAVLPEFREMGCHSALLDARILRASEAGCREIYSWAELGGQSQANMERAGLSVVGITATWRFTPESKV
jgi:N-acetylglutamate synthase-like GNAT family acetyltransferase